MGRIASGAGVFDAPDLALPYQAPDGGETGFDRREPADPWTAYLLDPARLTVRHEIGYKVQAPRAIQSNRTTLRLEYSKLYLSNFFVQFDSRVKSFWGLDHRTSPMSYSLNDRARKINFALESRVREAYLQASFLKTSIRAGIQILAWGESELGEITDVITARDYSEPIVLALEELRFGQPMVVVDQFTGFGKWTAFFVPYPFFNQMPGSGSVFYVDAFGGAFPRKEEYRAGRDFEYGARWIKTFGRSDVSLAGASVIGNDYAYMADGPSGAIIRKRFRYDVVGLTFNLAIRDYLLKSEVGVKSPLRFNDASLGILESDVFDGSFGISYLPAETYSASLEAVTSHIADWTGEFQGVARNEFKLGAGFAKRFLHDDLSLEWSTLFSGPYPGFFHIFSTTLKLNDRMMLFLDATIPIAHDSRNGLWAYRNQKQISLKAQAQY